MHSTSARMIMLAYAPHHVQKSFSVGPTEQCTPRTITNPGPLSTRSAEIRERGFARHVGSLVEENVGYSVAIKGADNQVLGMYVIRIPEGSILSIRSTGADP